jgi:hypothetical protein
MVKVLQIQAKLADLKEKYQTTNEYLATSEARFKRGKLLKLRNSY